MNKKRILSLLLVVAMLVGVIPAITFSASAAKENPSGSADRWFKPDLYFETTDKIEKTPLTIEAFVQLPSGISEARKECILLTAYNSAGDRILQIGTNSTGRPTFFIKDTVGGSKKYTFGKSGNYNPWPWKNSYTNMSFVIDQAGGYVYYYQDGVESGKQAYNLGALPTNLEFRIGGDRSTSNAKYFEGAIDYIALYDEALTAESLLANKKAQTWDSTKSLLAAWDLAKQIGTGNALKDRSGNGHTLKYFNGSGIKIDTFGTYTLDQSLSGMPETVEAWLFLPDAYTQRGGTFFGNWDAKDTTYDFAFEIYNSGVPSFFYANAEGVRETFRFAADITTGTWTHVVMVHDAAAGTASCYINGALVDTQTGATAFHPDMLSAICALGADKQSGLLQRYNGFIKELRVYSDQRTAEEIAADYEGKVDYTDEHFILHYDLTPDTEENNITDLTNNGNNVTYNQSWWEYDDVEHAKDYAYSFAIVGDTQGIVYKDSNNSTTNTAKMYDWIVNNVEDKNIQFVFGMGDITEKDSDSEWTIAKEAITKMDGVVPYSLVNGQGHDTDAQFDAYFASHEGYTNQLSGFYRSGSVVNTYQEFSVGATDYLVLSLESGIPDDVIAWANEVIAAHPAHRVIITTHMYLKNDGSYLATGDLHCATSYDKENHNNGDVIWEELASKHPNVYMVLCGHKTTSKVVISENTGDYGNKVTQMMVNPQGMDNASPVGMVAMLYFSADGEDVTVEYYSTLSDLYKPTQKTEISYGSTVAPSYEGISEKYVVAKNQETGLYSVIENDYFQFLGGSLRYDSGAATSANIRFGYQFSSSFNLKATRWSWNYGVAGTGLPSYVAGSSVSANNITNLVITGVPTAYFDSDLESRLTFDVELDGVSYTVIDRVRTRSVLGVAKSIARDPNEPQSAKDYAQTIINACAS